MQVQMLASLSQLNQNILARRSERMLGLDTKQYKYGPDNPMSLPLKQPNIAKYSLVSIMQDIILGSCYYFSTYSSVLGELKAVSPECLIGFQSLGNPLNTRPFPMSKE